ncbi:MAG: hypothetical protein IKS08_01095 [Alphaproteobacteria bacterium]|nr:hypothetical protein [Alphaproteobacteria bacterium]
MFKNRWIITKKFPVANRPRFFNYTIVSVDEYDAKEEYDIWTKCILSKRNLPIGTYTDDDLEPLENRYKYLNTDIATVEYTTTTKVVNPYATKISVFGQRFGEFPVIIDKQGMPFNIKRGDNILVQRRYDMADFVWPQESDDDDDDEYSDPILQDILGTRQEMQRRHEPEELVGPYFRVLYNLTTKRKAKSFPKTKKTKSKSNFGDCDMVVVTGITPITMDYDVQKHIFINSHKFGVISCLVDEYQSEFLSEEQDQILIEQYLDKNIGEILYRIRANKTLDNMRAQLLATNTHVHRR